VKERIMGDWPFRHTICGLAELDGHRDAGLTAVVSILDPGTPEPPLLAAFAPQDRLTLRFHDINEPQPEMVAPEMTHVAALLDFARGRAGRADEHVLVHCHMGISRSAAAAIALLLQARPEVADELALGQVLKVRPQAWPNARMIAFADTLLGRGGRLIAALARFQQSRSVA
jgi:predicted protein tyrosine phosphatase